VTGWIEAPATPALAPEEVHLWRIRLDGEPEEVAERAALLDGEERERMARFRFDVHRDRFALRRGAMRVLLGRYLGIDPRRVELRRSAHGKPEALQLGPGPRLRFNLSDSEDLALFAATLDADVGVDVERLRPVPEMERIARDHFSEREQAELAAVPAARRERAFFACWTRKEAWLKARGEGLVGNLAGFDVSLAPGRAPRLHDVHGAPAEAARWRLLACAPRRGWVGAVAVRRARPRLVKLIF
jgi:4'-phosphopantetheinyl transferase